MYNPGRRERGLKNSIDWKLVICYLLLVLFGFMNIYASIHATTDASILSFDSRSGKQFVWILTSLVLATMILFIFNPRLWEVISWPTYLLVVLLLIAVIFLGVEVKGSRSWFEFGPIRFQPAEISKIATSLVLATVMSQNGFKLRNTRDFLVTALVIGFPMLIIVAEQETGSALVYLGYVFVLYREGLSGWLLTAIGLVIILFIFTLTGSPYVSMIILLGLLSVSYRAQDGTFKRWFISDLPVIVFLAFLPKICGLFDWAFFEKLKPLGILLIICGLTLPVYAFRAFRKKDNFLWATILAFILGLIVIASTNFVFNNILQDHQKKRIEVLLGLKDDPSGVGYNVHQAQIAIGSGGFFGKGYLNGTQTSFGFVPEQSTDFIFCTVGEEWGFVGCLFVILLYVWMIYRLIYDAERCRETFTRIYGYCVASLIFMHLFVNIGMTVGVMPVIGIPLPFMSYGGSSLWAFTILLFIFIALYKEEKKYF